MIISSSLLRLYSRPSANSGQRIRLKRCLEGISLWLAVMLMLFVHPLYAEANETDNVGQFHFVDGQGQWQEPALILESDFDVRISGLIADSRLLRRFRNTSDRWREGVFVFPLPEKASVYGLTMKVGERTIEGKVQPKETARRPDTAPVVDTSAPPIPSPPGAVSYTHLTLPTNREV